MVKVILCHLAMYFVLFPVRWSHHRVLYLQNNLLMVCDHVSLSHWQWFYLFFKPKKKLFFDLFEWVLQKCFFKENKDTNENKNWKTFGFIESSKYSDWSKVLFVDRLLLCVNVTFLFLADDGDDEDVEHVEGEEPKEGETRKKKKKVRCSRKQF